MPEPVKKNTRYMPGLDGLRALALIGVMCYHWGLGFAPGGFLGVSIFFVLSGYLITDILASEWRREGRIDLKNFWYRRFRRLLPAMSLLLLIVVPWVTLTDSSQLPSLRQDTLAALTYVSNWQFIVQEVSYFESFGPPSPLGHMWSLAVEEQFYLLWPLIMLAALKVFPRRGQMFLFIVSLAGLSAFTMAVLYEPGTDPSRVYFGTDTRASGLLIGAGLAIIWPSWKRPAHVSPAVQRTLNGTGAAALVIILFMMADNDRYSAGLYEGGGMVLFSLAAAWLVAVLAHPAAGLGRWLGLAPLRWIGVRSYGIYLWHYPVIILTSPNGSPSELSPMYILGQLAASLLLATLSWKYIEDPIRQGALRVWWQKIRNPSVRSWKLSLRSCCVSACILVLLGTFLAGMTADISGAAVPGNPAAGPYENALLVTAPALPEQEAYKEERPAESRNDAGGDSVDKSMPKVNPAGSQTSYPSPDGSIAKDIAETAADRNSSGANRGDIGKEEDPPAAPVVTAIGDSVMLGVSPSLEQLFPGLEIHAEVGRQLVHAKELLPELRSQGLLEGTIIIGLGTNGTFAREDLESLLSSLSSAERIIVVNTRVPREWETSVNKMLSETVPHYPNAVLADWYNASKDHPEYFSEDGVHLKPSGAEAYAALIAQAAE